MAASSRRAERTGSGGAADRRRRGRVAHRALASPARASRGRPPSGGTAAARARDDRGRTHRRRAHLFADRPAPARLARARRGFGRPRDHGGHGADARRLCGLLALTRARRGFGRPRDHGGLDADARRLGDGDAFLFAAPAAKPSTPRREPQGARGRTKTRTRAGHAHKSPPSRARRGQTRRGRGDGQRRGRAQCTPKAALGLAGCSVPCAASLGAVCAVAVSRVPRPSEQFSSPRSTKQQPKC